MNDVYFIADFFVDQVNGGGELNNEILIQLLIEKGYKVEKANSHLVTADFIEQNKDKKYIIANFVNLRKDCIKALYDRQYTIYEHDHKYLRTRNPGDYPDFKAPKEAIINYEFYKEAKAVFCQSKFHSDIVKKNLQIDNIVNLGGNLWSSEALDMMRDLSKRNKKDRCSIMNSTIGHKNTDGAIRYCIQKGYKYDLILPCSQPVFLARISENDKFVFFPLTPETLSRIVVEARMMGMKVITNKRLGAPSEPWFKLKGNDLVEFMFEKRNKILNDVLKVING